ncbi:MULTISPECIES: helix-turn-helix domain-containing protein [unclassified Rhodococcus (in: high G+C Gram-positive bacteria)]|uniref:helix-turn-helix domain-containing protein n=1 Tax=Rhodococcus sp. SJ-3 TaxID=3454628 RepID=UPI002DAA34F0|nr:AraC family transcriptional regulator [Rhodococcus sp. (in: high G+C Gram-positive bacteria)]
MARSSTVVGISEGARRRPAPLLQPYVRWYEGYRLTGFPPAHHLGLSSPDLTVVLSLDRPVDITRAAAPGQPPGRFTALASGLATSAVTIAHDGNQHGIQLALTPAGARALLGVPTSALGAWVVDLEDLLGPDARELHERIAATPRWPERFAILDRILTRRLAGAYDAAKMDARVAHAWEQLVTHPGAAVREVADEVGWSRRYLTARFTAELGVTPKESARIARFDRSKAMLRRPEVRLPDVAVRCGFYDQAHLAREWREFAGVPPSRWRQDEVFPFVQDSDAPPEEDSVP